MKDAVNHEIGLIYIYIYRLIWLISLSDLRPQTHTNTHKYAYTG